MSWNTLSDDENAPLIHEQPMHTLTTTVNRVESDNESITTESGTSNPETEKDACVFCRKETYIDTFDELKSGDQIAVRGRIPVLGYLCYSHHAIIKDIKTAKRRAHMTVNKTDKCNIVNKKAYIKTLDEAGDIESRGQKTYVEYCYSHNAIVNSIGVNKKPESRCWPCGKEMDIETNDGIKVGDHVAFNSVAICSSYYNRHYTIVNEREEPCPRRYDAPEGATVEHETSKCVVFSDKCVIGNKEAYIEIIGDNDTENQSANRGQKGYVGYCDEHEKVVINYKRIVNVCEVKDSEKWFDTFDDIDQEDHVAIRYQKNCIGCCWYNHNAIVKNVNDLRENRKTAQLSVVDVSETGRYHVRERILQASNTAEWQLPSITWLGRLNMDICCKKQPIRRVDYRKRQNHKTTLETALDLGKDKKVNNRTYSLCFRNCEHFASACAIASKRRNKAPDEIISIQSHEGFWRCGHFIFWLIQALFYAFSFLIYAEFVANDKDYHFLKGTGAQDFIEKVCLQNVSCHGRVDMTCDWNLLAIYDSVITMVLIAVQLFVYQPLYRKGFLCKVCLSTLRLDVFSRLFTFTVLEMFRIVLGRQLYRFFVTFHTGKLTIPLVIGISLSSAYITYSVSSLITFGIAACFIPTCKEVREFKKYFRFRGIVFIVETVCRALVALCAYLKRRTKKKYNSIFAGTHRHVYV